ncbi:MAG: hypothetical protein AAGC79_05995 [Pseudomonadota bacterium]
MTETRKPEPTTLEEDDLDQAAGGIKMKHVLVSSYQIGGNAESAKSEEVNLNFQKIKSTR